MELKLVRQEATLLQEYEETLLLGPKMLRSTDMPDITKFAYLLKLIQNDYSPTTDIINLTLDLVCIDILKFY